MDHLNINKSKSIGSAFDQDSQDAEGLGVTMAAPAFQLFASASVDEDGSEGGSDPNTALADEILRIFKEKKISEWATSTFELLFSETNVVISEIWTVPKLNDRLLTFFNLLKLPHYLHYPREVAASLQAFDPATRQQIISEILQKYAGKSGKKASPDELEAAQVIFLMQGLENPAEDAAQQLVLNQLLKEHHDIAAVLKADVNADNEQMQSQLDLYAGPAGEGLTEEEKNAAAEAKFRTTRADLQQAVTQAEADLKAVLKKWGNIGYTTNISPENAIRAFEVLRGLRDEVRAEILRRYPDDVFSLNLNLPATYRGQLGFGIDESRGLSEKSPEFITAELAKAETWDAAPIAVNRLGLILGMALRGSFFSPIRETLEAHLASEVVWANPEILQKTLFLLSQGGKAAPSEQVIGVVQAKISPDNQALLAKLGFTAQGWTAPAPVTDGEDFGIMPAAIGFNAERKEARKRNKAENKEQKAIAKEAARQNGEKFDRKAFRESSEMTSGVPKTVDFLTDKNQGIDLIDFSLVDFQDSLGGDVTGMEFSRDADPEQFPDAGKIDAKIGEGSATIHSKSLPFDRLNYEMGSTLISCGAGFLSGVDAEFIWDEEKANAEMPNSETPRKVHTALTVKEAAIRDINYIGESSTLAIGNIAIQNLQIDLNQGIDAAGPVTGGWGMNAIQTIASEIQNMIFMAMNSIMTAIDPMMPDAGMEDAGSGLSALLMASFDKSHRLDLSFGAVLIENVMSQDSDTMRQVKLDGGQIQVGGSLVELYEAKSAAIKTQASLNEEDKAKIDYYEGIINLEKEKIKAHEQKIEQLRKDLAAGLVQESDLQAALAEGQLLVAASLSNASLVAGFDENGTEKHIIAPSGQIEVATHLNTPTLELDPLHRDQAKVAETAAILEGQNTIAESSFDQNQAYLEGENPLLPSDQAEIAGIDLNTILPGWLGGGLEKNGTTWTLKLRKPDLTINKFPDVQGVDFCPLSQERSAWVGLSNLEATVEITMNDLGSQRKEGLSPQRILIKELAASSLGGDNLEIRSDAFRVELREDSCLEGVWFRNLGIDLKKGEDGKQEPSTMTFGADKMSLNQVFASAGATLGAALQQFNAEDFGFAKYHQETIDPQNPNCRTDVDRMSIGFGELGGEGNSVTYKANPDSDEATTAEINITKLQGEMTTTSEKSKNGNDEWETESSASEYHFHFEIPGITVPSLNYGQGKDPFQIKGMDGGGSSPVALNGIKAEVTVTQSYLKDRKNEEGEAMPETQVEKIWVNKLEIATLKGNDLRVVAGGSPFDLKGAATLHGLYASGFEMDMAGDGGMVMHGSAGFTESQMEQLVMGMATVRDTHSGAFRIARLATDDGYEYSLEDLWGSAELDREDADGKQVDALGADLAGDGMSASGTLMDDGVITSEITLGEGVSVYQLDWRDANGSYRIHLPAPQFATLGPITASIEVKKGASGSKNVLDYVKIKDLKVDYLTAKGPHITFKDNAIIVPADKEIRIDNIVAKGLNYNLLTEKFTGKITADHIAGEAITRIQDEMRQDFLTRPQIELNDFFFEMEKSGDMRVGAGAGGVGIPSEEWSEKIFPITLPSSMETEDHRVLFAQIQQEMPFLTFSGIEALVPNSKTDGESGEEKGGLVVRITNPRINHLALSASEIQNEKSLPLVERMQFDGQIEGDLFVKSTPNGLQISNSASQGNGASGGHGVIKIPRAWMTMPDYHSIFKGNPQKEKGKESDPSLENNHKEGEYSPTGMFDVFDAASPAENENAKVTLHFLGGTAVVPIQDVLDPRDANQQKKIGGYVDLQAALNQIKPQAAALLATYLNKEILNGNRGAINAAAHGTMPLIERGVIENLELKKSRDRFVAALDYTWEHPIFGEITRINLKEIVLAEKLGEVGAVRSGDHDLLSLSSLIDYQVNKPSEPEKEATEPVTPEGIASEIMSYLGRQPFGVEVSNFNIDIARYQEQQAAKANEMKPGDTRPIKIGEMFSPTENGGKDLGMSLAVNMDPGKDKGPHVELSNFRAPGFHMSKGLEGQSFAHMVASASGMKVHSAKAKVENLSKPETEFEVNGLEISDFSLNLAKRK